MNNNEIYDILVIGMGPAGMAVSAMSSAMGLKVAAVEHNKVGGECLNVGCIPSKALLKAGEARSVAENLIKYGIKPGGKSVVQSSLKKVREKIEYISGPKTSKMFDKVELIKGRGMAEFVDPGTVRVGKRILKAKKIFIATGTEPYIPPIPGIEDVPYLTNVNMFNENSIPKKMTIIGGGAIGSEMAQAFSRLGAKVTIVHNEKHLIPAGDEEGAQVLQERFESEGISVYNSTSIQKVEKKGKTIKVYTDRGVITSDKLLVATGRKPVLAPLKLENAGIKHDLKKIYVDKYLRTNVKNIFAVGDVNGIALYSHAAMHQGMLALMNALNPLPFKMRWDRYIVPWSVFTKPEFAHAGLSEEEAKDAGVKYTVIKEKYEDYGRTIADGVPEGFVKVIATKKGKVLGATIVGESASELIHEWIMAIQYGIGLSKIMMMQHSFPTISLLNKRIGEIWMMGKMDSPLLQKIVRKLI
ncbi:MAG TPA: NAD(P)/FAD-dependent oxidoreductase [Spirochaetota bacterium]|nr:NAD(P)/FAD-dependent oxidoreductase [Spirochaetota bacterium]HPJ35057.1 NAD(P)/FAD-dependent oxidoreductase [Spirochaetota bacterium]